MKIRLRILTLVIFIFQVIDAIAQDPNPLDWANFKEFEKLNDKLPKMKKNKNE